MSRNLENFNTSLIDYLKESITNLRSEVEIGPLLNEILMQLAELPDDVEKNLIMLQINSILGEKGVDFQLALDEDGQPYFYTPESLEALDELKGLLDAA